MGKGPDTLHKMYTPILHKNLKSALAHRIGKDFPRLGGPRILELCAEMIMEVIHMHIRPLESLTHGQVLWLGVSVDDPPRRNKRITDTDLVPVILDISTSADIQAKLDRKAADERLLQKALRLCYQAFKQGAVLSNCDLAELLNTNDPRIATLLSGYEKKTGKVVPRRATVHDVGTALTHKRIICWKRYAEGKSSAEIARETYHSLEAVDRYLGTFDRVRHCRRQNMQTKEIAYTLDCSTALVQQYLEIDDELQTHI